MMGIEYQLIQNPHIIAWILDQCDEIDMHSRKWKLQTKAGISHLNN